jgi:thiamine biosynthesis lipoprotein
VWLCILSFGFLQIISCGEPSEKTGTVYITLNGKTMGTTYTVKYLDSMNINYQKDIDSLLSLVNESLSTYIPEARISRFNRRGEGMLIDTFMPGEILDDYFLTNYRCAQEVFKLSEGLFDPTVGPLVNAWGFGWSGEPREKALSENEIDSIIQFVGFEKLFVREERDSHSQMIEKTHPFIQLDFSALAKGFGVDEIAEFLINRAVRDFLVEVGGEIRVSGQPERGGKWVLGVNTPEENAPLTSFYSKVQLTDLAMATSGNYRNFYYIGGKKVFHSINPKTGKPQQNNMLSATVFHPDCMTADALATACMVMGLDKAKQMIHSIDDAEAYFIFSSAQGNHEDFVTEGAVALLKK